MKRFCGSLTNLVKAGCQFAFLQRGTWRPLRALAQTIMRHPWSSLQDALLLAMAMLVSALLALQYNLFSFTAELSDPKREISLSEAVVLTILLAFCIVAFILRRLYEERRDVARQVTAKIRMRELRWQASRDSLTNLANRRSMLKARLQQRLREVPTGGSMRFFL